jgi:hypothetical protein
MVGALSFDGRDHRSTASPDRTEGAMRLDADPAVAGADVRKTCAGAALGASGVPRTFRGR